MVKELECLFVSLMGLQLFRSALEHRSQECWARATTCAVEDERAFGARTRFWEISCLHLSVSANESRTHETSVLSATLGSTNHCTQQSKLSVVCAPSRNHIVRG